jgi:hypothetical protein
MTDAMHPPPRPSLGSNTPVRGSVAQLAVGLGFVVVAVWVAAMSYADLASEVRSVAASVARLERGLTICCGYAANGGDHGRD